MKKGSLSFPILRSEWPALAVVASAAATPFIGEQAFAKILDWRILTLFFVWLFAVSLAGVVSVARHAEALAELYREPLGTVILTLSVVTIEVIMIASILFHDEPTPTIARDTLYASLMIIVNGFLGLAVLTGGLKYGVQRYNLQSSRIYLSMLLAFWGLGFFVPSYLPAQALQPYKVFLTALFMVLYALFLWAQIAHHRYFFVSGPQRAGGPRKRRGRGRAYHIGAIVITFGGGRLSLQADGGSHGRGRATVSPAGHDRSARGCAVGPVAEGASKPSVRRSPTTSRGPSISASDRRCRR